MFSITNVVISPEHKTPCENSITLYLINKEAIFGFMQSLPELPNFMQYCTWHHVHVVRASSACRPCVICACACHLHMCVCCPHQDTSSAHCLQAICTTPHGHSGRNLLLNGICGRNVELFHFRIM